MRLLARYPSLLDAEKEQQRLEEAGIATFISSKQSYRLGPWFTGAFEVGLWVLLKRQYADAAALQRNPQHRVSHNLSREEIEQLKESIYRGDMSSVLNLLVMTLILALVAFLAVAILRP